MSCSSNIKMSNIKVLRFLGINLNRVATPMKFAIHFLNCEAQLEMLT